MNRTLSTLETLPAELLQKVFFYSLNPNLPRASPYLTTFFSNERVYRLLILLAFWDNDYQSYGGPIFADDPAHGDLSRSTWWEFNLPWILRPLGSDYIPLTSDERRTLQSNIVHCRWCTNDRIRRQFPDLVRLIIVRWCISTGYRFKDDNESGMVESSLYQEDPGSSSKCNLVRMDKQRREKAKEGERDEEEDEYTHCQVTVDPDEFVLFEYIDKHGEVVKFCFIPLQERPPSGLRPRWIPILSILYIPSSLLCADIDADHKGLIRGIFTEAHLSLLNTFRISGQFMIHMPINAFPEVTHSRDAIQQGIHIALTTLNPRALDILLKIDAFFHCGLRFQDQLPAKHFRTAALMYINLHNIQQTMIECTEDSGTEYALYVALLSFLLLLTSSAESLPHDDPVVRRFALLTGNAFGTWLLDYMQEVPQYVKRLVETDTTGLGVMFIAREFNEANTFAQRYQEEVVPTEGIYDVPAYWMFDELSGYGDHSIYL